MAERYIKEDLNLANWQISWLFGSFFLTYALGQVPAGWMSDRYGARRMLALYILAWSLFTGLMGLAGSFAAVLTLRLGCGLSQAGAYPTGAGIISRWVPFTARATASAIVSLGGRIGGAAAPVLTALLLVAFVPVGTPSLLAPADVRDEAKLRELIAHPDSQSKAQQQLSPRLAALLPAEAEWPDWLTALNDVLHRPDLYETLDIAAFPLESEAKRLAAQPADQLTTQQLTRRNRLLLEAAYPEQIRKLYGLGWRPVIILYGLIGIVVAGAYWLGVRDRPAEHPACNSAEVELIRSSLPATMPSAQGPADALPLLALVTNLSMWLNCGLQFLTNFGWIFLLSWMPRYLDEVFQVPIVERGLMVSVPMFAGLAALFVGGPMTDRLTSRIGVRWGRRLPILITRVTATLAFLACTLVGSAWAATIALAIVAVSVDLGIPAMWAFAQDVGGRNTSAVLGWGNMWGNFGAFVSPILLNYLITTYRWDVTFYACAGAFALSALLTLGVDAATPIGERAR
jgi:nitrate/nitrite transporter NarK